jgi:hypothetical protein
VPNWRRDAQLLAWAGGTAIQVFFATAFPGTPTPSFPAGTAPALTLPEVGFLYPLRIVGVSLVGGQWADRLWIAVGPLLVAAATAALIAGVLYVATRQGLPTRTLVLICVAESLLVFAVGTYLRGDARVLPTALTSNILTGSPRYTVVPVLFLYAGVALVVDHPEPRWKAATWQAMAVVMAAFFAFTSGMNFSMPNGRSGGPAWGTMVGAARDQCAVSPGATIKIPITPREWSVTIPCTVVLARTASRSP